MAQERIRELEERIERFRRKYGMDFEEFFELTEHGFGKLLEMGFDPDEVLRDVSEWEDLEDELEKLRRVRV